MGWTYTQGASRKDVIADLTKGWDNDVSSTRCLRRALRGNTLYAVMEVSYKDPVAGPPSRWLAVSLLQNHNGYGWGSKDMDESMGPCEVSCPLGFLDDVPDPGGYATEWRAKVRAFHARVNRKLAVGDTVKIGDRAFKLTSVRPLRGIGATDGILYRIPRSRIAAA